MKKNNKKAFSMIEVIIWVFIFSLWITSVYAIISSTLRLNDYNKNYIIASSLAMEQLELVRNIRDSNYKKIQNYNQLNPWNSDYSSIFEYDTKYKIENDFNISSSFPIKIEEIIDFWEWKSELNTKMQDYKLCLDSENRYTHDCSTPDNIDTNFFRYTSFEKVKYRDDFWIEREILDSYLVKSKVIWYMRWYHEFELKTIITDWKRL